MPPKRTHDHDHAAEHTGKMATNNVPTRGRKRFLFDLQNATQTVAQGVQVQGLRLSGKVTRRTRCTRGEAQQGCLIQPLHLETKMALSIA